MAEKWTLSTPITTPAVTDYSPMRLDLNKDAGYVLMQVKSNTGQTIEYIARGPEALAVMSQLNTANLSITSLFRHMLDYMNSKGVLTPGATTGTPD